MSTPYLLGLSILLLGFATQAQASFGIELTANDVSLIRQVPDCQVLLTESIPENLTYPKSAPRHVSTYSAWKLLIDSAARDIKIASFYWSLLAEDKFNFSSSQQGEDIFNLLLSRGRSVNVSIAENGKAKPDHELDTLKQRIGAQIYWLDVPKMLGLGILHTKLWTVDGLNGYVGSANMDWRSLTQVKELGVTFINCPELISDLNKIHAAYAIVSEGIPNTWPSELETKYNHDNPMELKVNGVLSRVYFSSSPSQFNPRGRNNDLDALLSVIHESGKFIYISVMNYSPEIVTYNPSIPGSFWPVIDDALRAAALDNGVEVRLLISIWPHTNPEMAKFLASLRALNGVKGSRIRIRYFIVPAYTAEQQSIPYSRVNHNKYMVTEKAAYIGTSNWSGDYFLYTGGVAFVSRDVNSTAAGPKTIRMQLENIFHRDWNSEYTTEL